MDISITLTMKELQRLEIAKLLIAGKISEEEAKKMMGLKSARQARRIKRNIIRYGPKGIIHRNRGRPGNRKFKKDFSNTVVMFYKTKYADFKPTLAAEKLWQYQQIKISVEGLRQLLIKQGLWQPNMRKKPRKRHAWRERKANYGEMEQFDGCYHSWFESRAEKCCLLLSIDDATGKLTHVKFDKHEGVIPVFTFWLEYVKRHGLPISIYLDKFSTYKVSQGSVADDPETLTQFQRALRQLDIRPISAHSPQAKGRVERVFGTLQDRLVKELRLAQIDTISAANKWLLSDFMPTFNAKFGVIPRAQANLHRSLDSSLSAQLNQIFSRQTSRIIMNDYTILFKGRYFQLEEKQPTTVFQKDEVIVEEHLDGSLKINLQGKYLKYCELPARPKKQKVLLIALTRQKAPWIPPANHPWRKKSNQNKVAAVTMVATG